ncbi:hypothetical protein JTB14_037057 [Gonioctena quinquepunctata]|nr:hypothetical protein JTB14_037057 [Gonioctena quinquepunctata]
MPHTNTIVITEPNTYKNWEGNQGTYENNSFLSKVLHSFNSSVKVFECNNHLRDDVGAKLAKSNLEYLANDIRSIKETTSKEVLHDTTQNSGTPLATEMLEKEGTMAGEKKWGADQPHDCGRKDDFLFAWKGRDPKDRAQIRRQRIRTTGKDAEILILGDQ